MKNIINYGNGPVADPDAEAVRHEAERLWSASQTKRGRFEHALERAVVRCMRIAIGVALAYGALHVWSRAYPLTRRPIGSLSLDDLLAIILYIVIGILLLLGAWLTAFGEYDAPKSAEAFMATAAGTVSARKRQAAKNARNYARSRLWGLLNDPAAVRSPKAWLIAAGFTAVTIAIIIAILAATGLIIGRIA